MKVEFYLLDTMILYGINVITFIDVSNSIMILNTIRLFLIVLCLMMSLLGYIFNESDKNYWTILYWCFCFYIGIEIGNFIF